jgi:choline dehydrogenase-like flavoprotein
MFRDARSIEPDSIITTEVCIIGGGVAGLAIARELSGLKIPSCVIESGGFGPDDETRDLYRGESVGLPYDFADGCRSRYLGGSSNCWGGWCRPMDPIDYERRSWVPHSGWPFGPDELAPYYARAQSILQLGINNYDTAYWAKVINRRDVRMYPLSGQTLVDGITQFSTPLRAGKEFREELRRSSHINVLLHANVTNILADPTVSTAQHVDVQTLRGNKFVVRARTFVLAAGGIENARILLSCNTQATAGLGNGCDLVGRFFMDHPRVTSGWVHLRPEWQRNKLYDNKFQYQNDAVAANGTRIAAQFSTTPAVQEREGLLNARVCLTSIFPGEHDASGDAIRRLRRQYEGMEKPGTTIARDLWTIASQPLRSAGFIAARLVQPQFLIRGVRIQATAEATPDPESRVTLSDARDRLNMRRVRVNWRLDENVKRTFDRMFELFRDELQSNNIARVDLDPPISGGEWPNTFEREGTWHHMGTTRMHDSPRHGVVDRNCLIHGMKNLYVAGSSVFPTGSSIYPTITLTALALRLANHIARQLNRA